MAAKPKSTRSGKTLADFAAAHDKSVIVPRKIEAALAKLGKDGWEYEADLMKLAGVNAIDFSRFREEFIEFSVTFKDGGRTRRAWAGTIASAAKLREMV